MVSKYQLNLETFISSSITKIQIDKSYDQQHELQHFAQTDQTNSQKLTDQWK